MDSTEQLPQGKLGAQELASRFVHNMVMWRCNSLIDFARNASDVLDHWEREQLEALMYPEPDYEEAATSYGWELFDALVGEVFVRRAEDELQMYEESARLLGWDLSTYDVADGGAAFEYEYTFVREAGATFPVTLTQFIGADDEDDAWELLCKKLELTTFADVDDTADDWQELCENQDIDTYDYRPEVYEWYIVDKWWCQKIGPAVLGDFLDFTIWGRTCTGQSICLDHNVQQAAIEMWPDEWNGKQ